YSLDDKRNELAPNPFKTEDWEAIDHVKNNIPDILRRWEDLDAEEEQDRKSQSFFVPKEEIADQKYDLNVKRYKEIDYDEIDYDEPSEIIYEIENLETEIADGLKEVKD